MARLRAFAQTAGCYTQSVGPGLTSLTDVDELDRLLAESYARPLLVFKHSYTCGISAEALDELVAHITGKASRPGDDPCYVVVTVQTDRDVSNAIAERLGVRHETPQALLIRDGRVVWKASHFRVTADAVLRAVSDIAR